MTKRQRAKLVERALGTQDAVSVPMLHFVATSDSMDRVECKWTRSGIC